jgi:hypothetical protein
MFEVLLDTNGRTCNPQPHKADVILEESKRAHAPSTNVDEKFEHVM